MGRGMLTGEIKSADDIPKDDMRRHMPRFSPENFSKNLDLVKEVERLAKQKGVTPAQLAVNWTRALSKKPGNPEIIPIPGSSTEKRVLENSKDVELSEADLNEIDDILKGFTTVGDRYPPQAMGHLEG